MPKQLLMISEHMGLFHVGSTWPTTKSTAHVIMFGTWWHVHLQHVNMFETCQHVPVMDMLTCSEHVNMFQTCHHVRRNMLSCCANMITCCLHMMTCCHDVGPQGPVRVVCSIRAPRVRHLHFFQSLTFSNESECLHAGFPWNKSAPKTLQICVKPVLGGNC